MSLNSRTKILLTGASGMLGTTIRSRLTPYYSLVSTSRIANNDEHILACDLGDQESLNDVLNTVKPHLIFHCGALTNLEYCEKNPEEAYTINVTSTETITNWSKRQHIPLVFISTAGIFNGQQEWYKEDDIARPLTVYGKTKLQAEEVVSSYEYSYIFRASWMIGGGPQVDKKIVGRMMKQLDDGVKELIAVNDIKGTVTYTEDLLTTMIAVLHEKAYGLYHVASEDFVTRYDITKMIVEFFDLPLEVRPVPSSYFSHQFFVERPKSECLISTKLKNMNLFRHRSVRDVMKEYLLLWR